PAPASAGQRRGPAAAPRTRAPAWQRRRRPCWQRARQQKRGQDHLERPRENGPWPTAASQPAAEADNIVGIALAWAANLNLLVSAAGEPAAGYFRGRTRRAGRRGAGSPRSATRCPARARCPAPPAWW